MPRDFSAILPAAVKVRFPTVDCIGAPGSLVEATYVETITAADAGYGKYGTHPGAWSFREVALARYTEPPYVDGVLQDPANKDEVHALALKIAQDFYAWRVHRWDRVYAGIIPARPEGYTDRIEWTYRLDRCQTRLRPPPDNATPELLQHYGSYCPGRNCVEVYGPPAERLGDLLVLPVYWVCIENDKLLSILVRFDEVPVCCPVGSSASSAATCEACYDSLPAVLVLTDKFGTIALTKDPSCLLCPKGPCCYIGGGPIKAGGDVAEYKDGNPTDPVCVGNADSGVVQDQYLGVGYFPPGYFGAGYWPNGQGTESRYFGAGYFPPGYFGNGFLPTAPVGDITSARSYCLCYDGGWKLTKYTAYCPYAGGDPTVPAPVHYGFIEGFVDLGMGALYSPPGPPVQSRAQSEQAACTGTDLATCSPLNLTVTFSDAQVDVGTVTITD